MARRRVAITGIGLITPIGVGTEATWESARKGVSGVGPIRCFDAGSLPCRIAAEVRDFDAAAFLHPAELRKLDRFGCFALVGAGMAVRHAGLASGGVDPDRFGCYLGSGLGGVGTLEARAARPPERLSPYHLAAVTPGICAGQIAIAHGCRGPVLHVGAACASSAHALGLALRAIQSGEADAMLAGGAEAMLTPLTLAGFCAMGAVSRRNDEPERASRPFDRDRDGFVLGEGAALLVLEGAEHAAARGAVPVAELAGYGSTGDAYHLTRPDGDGAGAARAMQRALADAGVAPEEVGHLNAHATGTAADAQECRAVRAVFGGRAERGLVTTSTKSTHGHLIGAAGALEAALVALALRDRVAPPTRNLDHVDPDCALDIAAGRERPFSAELAVSNSLGFGGTNASLVLRRAGGT